jgi:phosphoribosyl-ATP pyrophosphohydrolase
MNKINKSREDNNKINKKKMIDNNKIMVMNKNNNFKFHMLILKANQEIKTKKIIENLIKKKTLS